MPPRMHLIAFSALKCVAPAPPTNSTLPPCKAAQPPTTRAWLAGGISGMRARPRRGVPPMGGSCMRREAPEHGLVAVGLPPPSAPLDPIVGAVVPISGVPASRTSDGRPTFGNVAGVGRRIGKGLERSSAY